MIIVQTKLNKQGTIELSTYDLDTGIRYAGLDLQTFLDSYCGSDNDVEIMADNITNKFKYELENIGIKLDSTNEKSPQKLIAKTKNEKYKYLYNSESCNIMSMSFVYGKTRFIAYNFSYQIDIGECDFDYYVESVKYYLNKIDELGLKLKITSPLMFFTDFVSSIDNYKKYFGREFNSYYATHFDKEVELNGFNYDKKDFRLNNTFSTIDYYNCAYTTSGIKYFNELREEQNGISIDVNSMYSYCMHSVSGNYYPVSMGRFNNGETFDYEYYKENKVLFICRIKIKSINLKENKFDFIQHVHYNTLEDEYENKIYTFTSVDYELFLDTYDSEYEVVDYVLFSKRIGLFDSYIDKYYSIKSNAEPNTLTRKLAKSALEYVYGKMGSKSKHQENNSYNYMPVAAFVSAYARRYMINAINKILPRVSYVDTDSIHISDCTVDEISNVLDIDENKLGAFKVEAEWKHAIFVKFKFYVEWTDDKIIKTAHAGYDTNIFDYICEVVPVNEIIKHLKNNEFNLYYRRFVNGEI